jgi:hypothetical protein
MKNIIRVGLLREGSVEFIEFDRSEYHLFAVGTLGELYLGKYPDRHSGKALDPTLVFAPGQWSSASYRTKED